jgi:hypothetical protein
MFLQSKERTAGCAALQTKVRAKKDWNPAAKLGPTMKRDILPGLL